LKIKEKGFTLLELTVAVIVFFLFMAGLYATLDVGLKSWQIGEVKAELQQSGEVAMKRLTGELISSTVLSVRIDPDRYIAFETAVNPSDVEFKRDISNLGVPIWQAQVVYYALADPKDSEKFILYRNYKLRNPAGTTPQPLSDAEINLMCIPSGPDVKILARNLEDVEFQRTGNIVTITFIYNKHIRSGASVSFSPGGDSETGVEHFEIKSSVEPRN